MDVVHVTIYDGVFVVFDGDVSSDVQPLDLLFWKDLVGNKLLDGLCDKETGKKYLSFKGMKRVELSASSSGVILDRPVVLYVCNDGVLKSGLAVPSFECKQLSLWNVRPYEYEKAFQMQNLEELDVNYANELIELPSVLALTNLTKLNLNTLVMLRSIPNEIAMLSSLRELRICSCDSLQSLPPGIGQLKRLEKLELSFLNHLTALPDEMGGLSSLKFLLVRRCPIVAIPKSFGLMNQLENLRVHFLRNLEVVPDEVGTIQNLNLLELIDCPLKKLPRHLNLVDLCLSDLKNLQFSSEDTLSLSKLGTLRTGGCAFSLASLEVLFNALKLSTSLHSLYMDIFGLADPDVILSALEQNGSIVLGRVSYQQGHNAWLKRNRENHERAKISVITLLAIKRWGRGLKQMPKDVVNIVARRVWLTKCDLNSWNIVDRKVSPRRNPACLMF